MHDTTTPINRKQPKKQDKMNTKFKTNVLLKLSILYSCTTQHFSSSDSVITEKKQVFFLIFKKLIFFVKLHRERVRTIWSKKVSIAVMIVTMSSSKTSAIWLQSRFDDDQFCRIQNWEY